MDATTRWETEAIRASPAKRTTPPRPTSKRGPNAASGTWVTLKEAEAATGIPTNTLRKWVRKETVATYLESDGELALRMVDLDSIRERARSLGRDLATPDPEHHSDDSPSGSAHQDTRTPAAVNASSAAQPSQQTAPSPQPDTSPEHPEGTMLVPVDAWNKMLNQLGNLHEAGQQLADARERAAKAETESQFLRERLRELRSDLAAATTPGQVVIGEDHHPDPEPASEPSHDVNNGGTVPPGVAAPSGSGTTTYWRYLTTGWRDRRRRR